MLLKHSENLKNEQVSPMKEKKTIENKVFIFNWSDFERSETVKKLNIKNRFK